MGGEQSPVSAFMALEFWMHFRLHLKVLLSSTRRPRLTFIVVLDNCQVSETWLCSSQQGVTYPQKQPHPAAARRLHSSYHSSQWSSMMMASTSSEQRLLTAAVGTIISHSHVCFGLAECLAFVLHKTGSTYENQMITQINQVFNVFLKVWGDLLAQNPVPYSNCREELRKTVTHQ